MPYPQELKLYYNLTLIGFALNNQCFYLTLRQISDNNFAAQLLSQFNNSDCIKLPLQSIIDDRIFFSWILSQLYFFHRFLILLLKILLHQQMQDTPQVFIIGKISGAKYFEHTKLYVKYSIKRGDKWNLVSGKEEGETFQSEANHGKYVPFEHPFDLNYTSQSVRGWPKIFVEVWEVDDEGRNQLAGYGICTLPIEQGEYKIDIPCWRPQASFFDKMIGAYPELVHKDILVSNESRFGFKTESTGKIFMEVAIITKDFHLHGVKLSQRFE